MGGKRADYDESKPKTASWGSISAFSAILSSADLKAAVISGTLFKK